MSFFGIWAFASVLSGLLGFAAIGVACLVGENYVGYAKAAALSWQASALVGAWFAWRSEKQPAVSQTEEK